MAPDSEKISKRLSASKDVLLKRLRQGLEESNLLGDFDVQSIGLHLRRMPFKCPEGQELVFDVVTRPDGTVVYEWVCK